MKKVVALIFCVAFLSLSLFAQAGRTRPRVVVTDNLPRAEESPAPKTDANKRPPVLIGDTKPSTTSTPVPTSVPNADESKVSAEDEVIKVQTDLVTIPVTVLDRDGRFISGLQQSDFQIFEDDVLQKIDYFAPLEQPFTAILLIDVSNSTKFRVDEIQNAAYAFVNQLRANDRVMVISFDEKIKVLAQPTNNRNVLRDAISRIQFGGGTSLYDAVSYAINQELRRIEGRKAIVLFTDGVDTTSKKATFQSTIKEAEEIDGMIYPIRYDTLGDAGLGNSGGGNNPMPRQPSGGIFTQILGAILTGGNVQIGGRGGGGGSSPQDYARGKSYLEGLAMVSGGRKFEADTTYNLDAAFIGIAEELRRQYALGYYPEDEGQAGERRQIRVRVNRANAVVRAKNSYIVGTNGGSSTSSGRQTKPAPKTSGRLPF